VIGDFRPPSSDALLDWALAYAATGMRVFPVGANKRPLTEHGLKDALTDEAAIRRWWARWRNADVAWAVPADIVVLDLDVEKGDDGLKDFVAHERAHPDDVLTPQATTPTGGRHLVFSAGGAPYRNGVRLNGSAIDLRTAGGYIVLPAAGNGRVWLKPLAAPLAQVPRWVAPAPTAKTHLRGGAHPFPGETPYARAALERASKAIEHARNGEQEATLNRECFSIGTLVGAGKLDCEIAVAALARAAARMPAYAEPWGDLAAKVRRVVLDGMKRPRLSIEAADGDDRRPRFEVPSKEGELLPIMRLLDQSLIADEAEPPMRSPTGWPVEVRASEPAGVHELTAAGANADEEESDRLPPPKLYTLAPHNQYSMALMIERYVGFVKRVRSKDGDATVDIPKRLPAGFVTHYLHHDRSRLPRVSTLATMPLVLPDGPLLATNGLCRSLRTVFRIDPEIVDLMPCARVRDEEVAEAIKFLTDEWLVDVTADYADKCVLIALALSIIERGLFGERPAFFVTAGKRGGGKTTALNMIGLALFGKRASAVPWSNSEEERRKSIFAALLQSVSFIVFDNIAAGSTISCPVVEEALTASEMEDRVLGESRRDRASCSAIMAFTGNNILPKGDLASRSLEARIKVDRPDPENRAFAHPDPFGWTLDRRRKIIAALYAILLGNPRLREKRGGEKTRFKAWWRLVGAAIEHAAEKANRGVDFGELFLKVEEKDEEGLGLADALRYIDGVAKGEPFRSAEVLTWTNFDTDEARALRSYLGGSAARPLTATAITRKLNAKTDAPTKVYDAVWTLTSTTLTAGGITQFGIAKRRPEQGSRR
jgi:hypothetical protein